jgi:cytochrome c biogenesis protein CcmG, thiol:disulfide interchange protein DsbE
MRHSIILAATLVSLLATVVQARPKTGQPAPAFEIKLFDSTKVTLEDYRGKVVVINYWATWCGPCKAEIPMMSRYHQLAKARGFEIIGVVTKDSVSPKQLTKLSSVLSYPLASDLKGKYGLIDDAVPTNYVIDRKGVLRYAKAGSFETKEFIDLINPLLNESP